MAKNQTTITQRDKTDTILSLGEIHRIVNDLFHKGEISQRNAQDINNAVVTTQYELIDGDV